MLCVEVTVNGTRRCLADIGDLAAFRAWIVHDGRHDGSATTRLEVTGVSRDQSTKLVWARDDLLGADQVVTIRVVDDDAPDVPVAAPAGISQLVRDLLAAHYVLPDRDRRSMWNVLPASQRERTLLVWVVLVYIGALLQRCG
jgi:hypothetical protein